MTDPFLTPDSLDALYQASKHIDTLYVGSEIRMLIDEIRRLRSAAQCVLEDRIREYANDLRRNSSGGDNYPWGFAIGVADYLETLIKRSTLPSTPSAPGPIGKRAAEFIRTNDPFGDAFSEHDLRLLAGEPTGNATEYCRVCGGDCGSANPPVMNCPMRDDTAVTSTEHPFDPAEWEKLADDRQEQVTQPPGGQP